MSSHNIRISDSSKTVLRDLAAAERKSMQAVLDAAIERYRREKFLAAASAGYAALRRNPMLWKEELDERALWDRTVADGTK